MGNQRHNASHNSRTSQPARRISRRALLQAGGVAGAFALTSLSPNFLAAENGGSNMLFHLDFVVEYSAGMSQ